jgi:hypothetical protein
VEFVPGDFPPPQDAVNMTLPTMVHASTAGKTRRALLKLPANTKPAMPNERIQLAYIIPPVRGDEFFAPAAAFVIFSVEVAAPLPGVMVAGENEQSRLDGR